MVSYETVNALRGERVEISYAPMFRDTIGFFTGTVVFLKKLPIGYRMTIRNDDGEACTFPRRQILSIRELDGAEN